MDTKHWQLQLPVQAILFDCDGTLSAVEGINELARNSGHYELVEKLTTEAMEKSGLNPLLYQQRLALIQPKKQAVIELADCYYGHLVPDAREVIALLQRLQKTVYLVSAGVNPAVSLFGEKSGISAQQIFAVDLQFDLAGNYLDFDKHSPLIHNQGKKEIASRLKARHERIIHIGDGLNDYVTRDIVTRFIGYGGVYYREELESRCAYYIQTASLAPLLALCLTRQECLELTQNEEKLYQKGLEAINRKEVKV